MGKREEGREQGGVGVRRRGKGEGEDPGGGTGVFKHFGMHIIIREIYVCYGPIGCNVKHYIFQSINSYICASHGMFKHTLSQLYGTKRGEGGWRVKRGRGGWGMKRGGEGGG